MIASTFHHVDAFIPRTLTAIRSFHPAQTSLTTSLLAKTAKKRQNKNKNFGNKDSPFKIVPGDPSDESRESSSDVDSDPTISKDPRKTEAETIIRSCVDRVGASVLELKWHATQVVVTLNEEFKPTAEFWNLKEDDEDGDNEDFEDGERDDEDEMIIMDEAEEEFGIVQDTDDLGMIQDDSEKATESVRLGSAAISSIARLILDEFEERENELNFLDRYELILSSPGARDIIETQRQFNAFRGFDVIVETNEPVDSKKELFVRLIERNDVDLVVNKKGKKLKIPLEKVKCVRLPPAKREKGVPRDAPF